MSSKPKASLSATISRLYGMAEKIAGGPKNMEKINYLVFGGLTTLVNFVVYQLAKAPFDSERAYLFANGPAWVAAVAFAFVTNKFFVFRSKSTERGVVLRELGAFVAARLLSLAADYGWMILAVEAMKMDDNVAKILSYIIVIVMNYFFSKLFIFRNRNPDVKKNTKPAVADADANADVDEAAAATAAASDAGDDNFDRVTGQTPAVIAASEPQSHKQPVPFEQLRDSRSTARGDGSDGESNSGGGGVGGDDGAESPESRGVFLYLSFFMPIALLSIAFAVISIYPFGNNSILIIDNHHQYTPFLIEFGERLRNFKSLLYSWTGGLGSNYLSRFAYYLSSPLNFLSVFTDSGSATEFVLALVLFRAGAAGAAFFIYLRSKFKSQGFLTVAFAAMYSMCNFFLAYYWNIMWFDSVAVFPLIALGIERIVDRESAGLMYCLSLSYAIIANYFIGIMICIFSALYFATYAAGNMKMPERRGAAARLLLRKAGKFALYSIIAGAMSAVVTIPAYYGLLRSSAAGAAFPKSARVYSDIIDIIANHFALIKPSIMVGLPNIYCGVAVLLLVPLYFLNRAVPFREKIANGLLVCFFIVSFNNSILDFLWHGTHFPNSLFFRFAFLYVFLALTMAYHALHRIGRSSGREAFVVLALLVCFILFMETRMTEKMSEWTVYGSIAIAMAEAVALVMLIRKRRGDSNAPYGPFGGHALTERRGPFGGRAAEIALAALICAELTVNAGYGIGEAGVFTKSNYLMKADSVKQAVRRVSALERLGGDGFERVEFTAHTTYNTPIVYGYKGISYYSSTSNVAVNDMFGRLGLIYSNAWYVYRSAPPTLNSMFAIKYLMSQDGFYDNGVYNEIDVNQILRAGEGGGDSMAGTPADASVQPNAAIRDQTDAAIGDLSDAAIRDQTDAAIRDLSGAAIGDQPDAAIRVYENPFFLPLGFMVDESVLAWNPANANPFVCQEDFYRRACGLPEPLFQRLEPSPMRLSNMTVTSSGSGAGAASNGTYRYTPNDASRDIKAVYRVTAENGGPIYVYVKGVNIETVKITNKSLSGQAAADGDGGRGGGEPLTVEHNVKYPYIIDAQFAQAGDDVEIEILFEESDADSFTLLAYSFDQYAFYEVWKRLRGQTMRVAEYTDTSVTGTVEVRSPGLLYTSIPFDEGWSVKVDGEPAQAESVADGALLALRLEPGVHEISFNYMTPGLALGVIVTIGAIILLVSTLL